MTRPASARWFWWALAGVAAVGLAIRVTYILVSRQDYEFGGDAFFYHGAANFLADGKGFTSPFFLHRAVQAGEHPPLYLMYLAIPSIFGFQSVLAHLLWSAVLGIGTIVLVGLTGREIGGPRLGVIAAGLAATYPNLWVPDGSLMAETLSMFATALTVYLAYRYWRDPRWGWLAAVGAAGAAGALSRSELILIVPFLVVPLALLVRGPSRNQRWAAVGSGALAALVVVAPWIVFNLTRFERPVFLTSSYGSLLSSSNCDEIWTGHHRSYFSVNCTIGVRDAKIRPGLDQSEEDVIYRDAALEYVGDHADLIPGIAAARVGAILGLYHPELQIHIDGAIEGRGVALSRAGMYSFYALALLSVAGAIALRRRHTVPVFPLLVLPVIVLITVVLTYASTRFRSTAEVALCLLAAVAIDSAASAVLSKLRARKPPRVSIVYGA